MSQIQIRQTMGTIGIETQRAKVEIQQNCPRFYARSIPARLKINRKLPKFKIVQDESLMASGYKTNLALSSLRFQKARQKTIEAIGKIAQEGDAIMKLENRGNPISEIALENSIEHVDINVGIPPQNRIEWEQGFIEVEWTPHSLEFFWDVYPNPKYTVHPQSVKIFVKRKPSLEISFISNENKLKKFKNILPGKKVDKKI